MLRTIVDRLEPLLGDFYRPQEMPFVLAINAEPVDELGYLAYSDWLEERADARAHFLRLFTRFWFHEREPSAEDRGRLRKELQAALAKTSQPWLQQLFGTSARFREIKQRIDAQTA